MRLDYTPEQQQLRDEIRATMKQVMTPERQAAVSERAEGGPDGTRMRAGSGGCGSARCRLA